MVVPTPMVHVYANILSGGCFPEHAREARSIGPFWHYARYLASGTGKATFSIAEAADIFEVAESTVRRWLKVGKEHRFFRDYRSQQGIVTVFPTAVGKLLRHLGFKSLGAVAEIPLDKLKLSKLIATEIQLQQQQRSSRFLAQKKAREQGRKTETVSPEELVTPSGKSPGVLIFHLSDKRAFVKETFIPYGVSQESVARASGISRRTVNRRLSSEYRQQRGLEPLPRRQICQYKKEYTHEFCQRRLTKSEGNGDNLFLVGRQVFKGQCNVYCFLWKRVSRKAQKYRYKKFLASQEGSAPAPQKSESCASGIGVCMKVRE